VGVRGTAAIYNEGVISIASFQCSLYLAVPVPIFIVVDVKPDPVGSGRLRIWKSLSQDSDSVTDLHSYRNAVLYVHFKVISFFYLAYVCGSDPEYGPVILIKFHNFDYFEGQCISKICL
jgi:hypothetical protein